MNRLARFAVVALLVAYGLLSVYSAASAYWQTRGTFGLLTDYGSRIRAVTPGSPAAESGISTGDRIDLKSVSFDQRRFLTGVAAPPPVGVAIAFRVRRGVDTRAVSLTAVPLLMTGAERFSLGLECIASLIFIAVGAALILLHPSSATWGFGLYCLIVLPTAPIPFQLASGSTALTAIGFYDIVQNVGVVGLLVFALEFPRPLDARWRIRVHQALPALFVVLATMTLYPDVATLLFARDASAENHVLQIVFGAVFALAIFILWDTFRHIERDERERMRWVLVGFGVGLVASYVGNTLIYSSLLPFAPPDWFLNVLVTLNVLLPLTVSYAVIRHRVLEIDFVISRALIYTALTIVLAGLFGLLDWLFSHVLEDFRLSLLIDAGISVGIAFAFDMLHKRAENLIEALFFWKRRAAEVRLNRLTRNLRQARTAEVVEKALIDEVIDALELTSAALFLQNGDGKFHRSSSHGWHDFDCQELDDTDLLLLPLRDHEHSVRLAALPWHRSNVPNGAAAPLVALAVRARSDLAGIVLYGGHTAGSDLDSTELAQLDRLTHAAGIAFDELEAERLRAENQVQTTLIDELHARLDEVRDELRNRLDEVRGKQPQPIDIDGARKDRRRTRTDAEAELR